MGDSGGIFVAMFLKLTEKMGEKPWITALVFWIVGMLEGFLIWAIGVK